MPLRIVKGYAPDIGNMRTHYDKWDNMTYVSSSTTTNTGRGHNPRRDDMQEGGVIEHVWHAMSVICNGTIVFAMVVSNGVTSGNTRRRNNDRHCIDGGAGDDVSHAGRCTICVTTRTPFCCICNHRRNVV